MRIKNRTSQFKTRNIEWAFLFSRYSILKPALRPALIQRLLGRVESHCGDKEDHRERPHHSAPHPAYPFCIGWGLLESVRINWVAESDLNALKSWGNFGNCRYPKKYPRIWIRHQNHSWSFLPKVLYISCFGPEFLIKNPSAFHPPEPVSRLAGSNLW